MPVQRIPRYNLLLEELLSHTSSQHPDYHDLCKALKMMKEVANIVNESLNSEMSDNIIKIQKAFIREIDILAPDRKFIRQGSAFALVEKGRKEKVTLFLFNDIILIAKKHHKLRQHISLLTSSIKKPDTLIENEDPNLCFILNTPMKVWTFITKSKNERDSWITDITLAKNDLLTERGSVIITQMVMKHGGAALIITDDSEPSQVHDNTQSSTSNQSPVKDRDTQALNEPTTNNVSRVSNTKMNSDQKVGGDIAESTLCRQWSTTNEQRNIASSSHLPPPPSQESNSESSDGNESFSRNESSTSNEKYQKNYDNQHKTKKEKCQVDCQAESSTEVSVSKGAVSIADTKNATTVENRLKTRDNIKNSVPSTSRPQTKVNQVGEGNEAVLNPHSNLAVIVANTTTVTNQNINDTKRMQSTISPNDAVTTKTISNNIIQTTWTSSENKTTASIANESTNISPRLNEYSQSRESSQVTAADLSSPNVNLISSNPRNEVSTLSSLSSLSSRVAVSSAQQENAQHLTMTPSNNESVSSNCSHSSVVSPTNDTKKVCVTAPPQKQRVASPTAKVSSPPPPPRSSVTSPSASPKELRTSLISKTTGNSNSPSISLCTAASSNNSQSTSFQTTTSPQVARVPSPIAKLSGAPVVPPSRPRVATISKGDVSLSENIRPLPMCPTGPSRPSDSPKASSPPPPRLMQTLEISSNTTQTPLNTTKASSFSGSSSPKGTLPLKSSSDCGLCPTPITNVPELTKNTFRNSVKEIPNSQTPDKSQPPTIKTTRERPLKRSKSLQELDILRATTTITFHVRNNAALSHTNILSKEVAPQNDMFTVDKRTLTRRTSDSVWYSTQGKNFQASYDFTAPKNANLRTQTVTTAANDTPSTTVPTTGVEKDHPESKRKESRDKQKNKKVLFSLHLGNFGVLKVERIEKKKKPDRKKEKKLEKTNN
jgi:hypothetical protein